MAQHDYNIANQTGANFRADLNNALEAIATVNSGGTEPSTTFAHQLWVDTSSSKLKIRNSDDNSWITTGVSITASNTFIGNLTGNVTGDLTGNVTGNVTGDLTGNADSADTLSTARTISLSGDVVGSVSFDGSSNIDIDTVVQINSITLGTDTTGDYVESMSGGTGVTVTGGTGEGSTPSIAIGQSVATTDNVTFNLVTATNEFIGDIDGAVRFTAKTTEDLSKGDVVYVSGVSGNTATVSKAKADDASKMPAFGLAIEDANANNNLQIVTLGNLMNIDTSNFSEGQILYVSTTAGEYTTTIPSGESSQVQNIGKVLRSHAVNGSVRVGGAGRSNATPNLNNGNIFIGNASNQSVTATLDTSIVVENTNLYYTTTRANTDFDTRLATKDTGDLTEGSNLYYTTARANTDFDTRLATKSTSNLAEGTNLYYTSARFDSAFTSKDTDDLSEGTTNLYYTTARFDSAFGNKTTSDLTESTNLYYTDTRANSAIDARVTKAFVDALNIQAASVDANSVTLGTDTVGNYIQTITGTANKITVSGSGSESADVTLTLPDDVQIADSLTVAGNLTVNGTLTSLDTTNLDIEDNLFQLNAGLTGSPVNDSGMLINRGNLNNSIFMWDESVDKFTMGLTTATGGATGNITLNSLGTLVVNVEGNLTGNVTGTVSSLSNHDTADLTEGANLYYTDARVQAVSINNVVEDTTPQLGGNLDLNSSDITGTGDINITGTIQSSGNITGTLATASQPNITSVGTLTGFTSTGIDDNATSTAITIDSSENVGIGMSPTNTSNYTTLDISNNTGSIINLNDNETRIGSFFNTANDVTVGNFSSTGFLGFRTNSTERMRIDSSGNVGIGNTNPADYNFDTGVNLVVGSSSTNGQIQVLSGTSGIGYLAFADGVTGAESYRGLIQYDHASNYMALRTNGSERIRIDSSGNVGLYDGQYINWRLAPNSTYRGGIRCDSSANMSFETGSGGSERMRIDSNGQLLLGTTTSDSLLSVDIQNTSASSNNTLVRIKNTIGSEDAGLIIDGNNSGQHEYRIGVNTVANTSDLTFSGGTGYRFYTGSNERMRIDSSGRVGIGTTSPSAPLTVSGADGTLAVFTNASDADFQFKTASGVALITPSTGTLAFGTSNTERLRIDSSGTLLLGTTTSGGAAKMRVVGTVTNANVGIVRFDSEGSSDTANTCISIVKGSADTTTSQVFVKFAVNGYNSGNGQINANGSGAVAFGSFSDRRLKENITDLPSQLANIIALQPKEFDYIESEGGGHQIGFIAQEVEEIYPDLVGEREDGKKTLTGMGKMEARLIKAIQEQQTQIDALQSEINLLKGE